MAGVIGTRLRIDTAESKSQVDALSGAFKKLNENIRDTNNNGGATPRISGGSWTPRLMGTGEAGLRPGEAAAIPEASIAAKFMPPIAPRLTGQYGVNSYYGQMSAGGILSDGRRIPTAQFDIEQVKDQIEGLGGVVEDLTERMQEALKNNDLKSIVSLSTSLEYAKNAELSMRKQVNDYEREEKKMADRSSPMKQFGSYMAAHFASQVVQSLINAGSTIIGSEKTLAAGDYAGAAAQREKGMGRLIIGGAGTLLGAAIGSFIMPGVGTLSGAGIGGKIGDFLGGLSGDISERDLAFSQNYKDKLPIMESFYQRFGGNINAKTGEENSRAALDWYNRASDMSYGTGKTADELMQAAQNRAAYGNFSGEESLAGARKDIMWERYTGASLSNIQRMSGLALRYDGDTDAIQKAFAGLQVSGMGKGQFDEFLTSMQRIMEDGIEKGFVRGADEIAGNMAVLSKLSGEDPLWTGEQGANRLLRINESVSNATNLRMVEDVLSLSAVEGLLGKDRLDTLENERELNFYRLNGGTQSATLNGDANFRSSAGSGDNIIGQIRNKESVNILGMEGDYARVNRDGKEGYIHKSMLDMRGISVPYTGTYVDNMVLLERGLRPELLGAQMRAVQDAAGVGNTAGQIEHYRNMFGLNYTGAVKIWEMSRNEDFLKDPEKYKEEIEEIRTNADYKSDSQKLTDAITTLTTTGVNIGKITLDNVEIPKLEEAVEIMEKIHEDLVVKYGNKTVASINPYTGQIRGTINMEDMPGTMLYNARELLEGYEYNGKDIYNTIAGNFSDDIKNIPSFGEMMYTHAEEITKDGRVEMEELVRFVRQIAWYVSNKEKEKEINLNLFTE
jgi:hypothetical protein